ncbi:hypothetical protein HFP89_07290 [Wenzhouxiangella sp. XN79A]|uniref:hypothetical protein n=1 Tax=Wenzhouxiangella sp. XN79A TaxID=2724193 RepID=UPI00144A83A3|nr:hypothetical protein [Wenzhouxiangella sp. XN79A]NKI34966.1 hypothetical protein [Wenzhouxiangella sp. XN79A]
MIRKGLIVAAVAAAATVAWAQEAKEPPPSGNSVGPDRGVISDNFGYTFTDSASGDCAFDFIDIASTGASVVAPGVDDGASAPVPIPTDFDFYGTQVTDLVMASNGYLSTDPTDTGPDLSNDCPLPAAPSSGGGARIYPLNDDLVATGGGFYEYFASCPRASDQFPLNGLGCHVFQWEGATHFGGGGPFTFQVVLYDESYEIVFQHLGGNSEEGSGSTTGIQNAAADDGLTYACDTAATIVADSAQCFIHPAPSAVGIGEQAIPTMSRTGLIAMVLVLMALGGIVLVRRAG